LSQIYGHGKRANNTNNSQAIFVVPVLSYYSQDNNYIKMACMTEDDRVSIQVAFQGLLVLNWVRRESHINPFAN
jgi:hypothetical protein